MNPDVDHADDPFIKYRRTVGGKDHDFFVIPRINQTEDHRLQSRRLQQYNNQVIARHQKIPAPPGGIEITEENKDKYFFFVHEGVLNTTLAGRQIANSIPVFCETKGIDDPNDTGNELNNLKTIFPYRFKAEENVPGYTYGHLESFIDIIAHSYSINKNLAKSVIFDRYFIYGDKEVQTTLSEIEGLENLYQKVVQTFRQSFINEAHRYITFQYLWRTPNDANINPNGINLSTVTGANVTNLDSRDVAAINSYEENNGVPYKYGQKKSLADFNVLQQLPPNWNSYDANRKPCTDIGLDCSGLVMNCLLDTEDESGNKSFVDTNVIRNNVNYGKLRAFGENASRIGECRVRKIPLDIRTNNDTLVQIADLLFSNDHIAICLNNFSFNEQADLNSCLTTNEIDERYFKIIHSYGGNSIIGVNGPINGFFKKTLFGPFRHWNVSLNNIACNVGRIYLWY
ncbi:MAG: hypothetical protein LBU19_01135 [Treponema sp.]|jgi:hypothetical protein|nr:hypothetical protein [Treponema sp.]